MKILLTDKISAYENLKILDVVNKQLSECLEKKMQKEGRINDHKKRYFRINKTEVIKMMQKEIRIKYLKKTYCKTN